MSHASNGRNTVRSEQQIIEILNNLDQNGMVTFFHQLIKIIDKEDIQNSIKKIESSLKNGMNRIYGEPEKDFLSRKKSWEDAGKNIIKIFKLLIWVKTNYYELDTSRFDSTYDPEVYESKRK